MLNYNNYARKDNNIGKYIFQCGFKLGLFMIAAFLLYAYSSEVWSFVSMVFTYSFDKIFVSSLLFLAPFFKVVGSYPVIFMIAINLWSLCVLAKIDINAEQSINSCKKLCLWTSILGSGVAVIYSVVAVVANKHGFDFSKNDSAWMLSIYYFFLSCSYGYFSTDIKREKALKNK